VTQSHLRRHASRLRRAACRRRGTTVPARGALSFLSPDNHEIMSQIISLYFVLFAPVGQRRGVNCRSLSNRRLMAIIAPLLALLGATAAAQVSKVSATLEGTLTDSSGAVIPSAEIKLRNIETNQTRMVKTDGQGFYRASELTVGAYEVRVDQNGFAPYRHTGVVLSIGQTTRLNIELAAGGATDAITVTDQPPVIDPSQPTFTTIIETEKIAEL